MFVSLLTTVLLQASPEAATAPLIIGYTERPPYHYAAAGEGSAPHGLVADTLVAALAETGIKATFVAMPATRLQAEVKEDRPICTLSWYKTEERSAYARFSVPLHQDSPYRLVARREDEALLRASPHLADLAFARPMRIGVATKATYGPFIDNFLTLPDRNFTVNVLPNKRDNMIRMLAGRRFDILFLSDEEYGPALESSGLNPADFVAVPFDDIPPGGKRRLMCSKALDAALFERLDKALRARVAPELLKDE